METASRKLLSDVPSYLMLDGRAVLAVKDVRRFAGAIQKESDVFWHDAFFPHRVAMRRSRL